jgi:hypothetical protein
MSLLRALALAFPLAIVVAFCAEWLAGGGLPGDAVTLMAAGERLNAGHPLYALSPGDDPVLLNPPFWTVPLLSPPFLAVVARPFASLPDGLGAYVWWAAMIACSVASILLLLGRMPLRTSLVIAVLSVPIAVQLMAGNIDSALLLGMIGVWWLSQRGRQGAAGMIGGIMAVTKLTPIPIVWWFVVARRWGSVRASIAAGVLAVVVGVAGAGIDAHVAYLDVIRQTNQVGTTVGSVAGLGRTIGVPPDVARWFPVAVGFIGLALMALFRRQPRMTWAIAVFTCVLGSPSVAFHTPALLLAALAPLAWPWGEVTGPRRAAAIVPTTTGTPSATARLAGSTPAGEVAV